MTIDNIANIMPISSESVDDVLGPVPTASHASNGTGEPPKNETSQTSWRVWSNEERKLEAEEGGLRSQDWRKQWYQGGVGGCACACASGGAHARAYVQASFLRSFVIRPCSLGIAMF